MRVALSGGRDLGRFVFLTPAGENSPANCIWTGSGDPGFDIAILVSTIIMFIIVSLKHRMMIFCVLGADSNVVLCRDHVGVFLIYFPVASHLAAVVQYHNHYPRFRG
jgi:hypothetical protein